MKKTILASLLTISVVMGGCGNKTVEDKAKVTVSSGEISKGIKVGEELAPYTFKDQFDVEHSLTNKVKKVIFVFTKPTGHLMRVFLGQKEIDYLDKRDIDFIADVSGMPSVIYKMFALPDLKNSKYPILIIKEKENALRFRNEEQKNAVMIISLKNKIVQNVKFVTNEKDLASELD